MGGIVSGGNVNQEEATQRKTNTKEHSLGSKLIDSFQDKPQTARTNWRTKQTRKRTNWRANNFYGAEQAKDAWRALNAPWEPWPKALFMPRMPVRLKIVEFAEITKITNAFD